MRNFLPPNRANRNLLGSRGEKLCRIGTNNARGGGNSELWISFDLQLFGKLPRKNEWRCRISGIKNELERPDFIYKRRKRDKRNSVADELEWNLPWQRIIVHI